MTFTGEQAAVILGVAPQTNHDVPRETPLELWERLVYGRQDRNADFRALLRAVEEGLLGLLTVNRALPASPQLGLTAAEHMSYVAPDNQPSSPGQNTTVACGNGAQRGENPAGHACDQRSFTPARASTLAVFAPWHDAAAWDVDGPPPWLVVRVQHDLAVTGRDSCEGGILLAGGAWRRFAMRADPRRQAVIAQALAEFATAVETRTPPAVTDEADLAVVKRILSPTEAAGEVDLGEAGTAEWRALSGLRARSRQARAQLDALEARLRQRLGGAAIGRLVGARRLALRVVRAPGGHVGSRLVELH